MAKKSMSAISGRAIYLATVVAIVGVAGGAAMAAVLNATTVNEAANFYQGGNTGANGYSSPTLQVSTTPTGTSVCSSSPVSSSTSGGTLNVVVSSTSGGTTCTAGDFAEEFAVSFSSTISSQSNVFTVTTQVGAGTVQSNSVTVTLGTGTAGSFTKTVDVYVDYGSVNPPSSGVTSLDLVIQ
jgi:hypothetical protein